MDLDIDALKRARAETQKGQKPHTMKYGGKTYQLPNEAPFEFAELLAVGDYRGALTVLLDGKAGQLFAANPTVPDMEDIVNGLADVYTGKPPGESLASPSS